MKQNFKVGDHALYDLTFRVEIVDVTESENGELCYKIKGLDLPPAVRKITKIVPQESLRKLA